MKTDSTSEKPSPQTGPTVTITVNTKTDVKIHRGHQTAAAIKAAGEAPAADDLEQLVNGQLILVTDGVTIKGGEVFVTHPHDGGSS